MAEPTRQRDGRNITVERLVEDFLAHCRAKNLSARTIEWYGYKYGAFIEWCRDRRIFKAAELETADLEEFVAVSNVRRGGDPGSLHCSQPGSTRIVTFENFLTSM